jgi:hypothetical protein
MIEGVPSKVTAGTAIKLTAQATGSGGGVSWSASAGSVTSAGIYVAPSASVTGRQVTLTARTSAGASDQRVITVLRPPNPQPAPELAPQEVPAAGSSQSPGSASAQPLLAPPQGRRFQYRNGLIVTTRPGASGVVALSAYSRGERVGGCSARTPAGRAFSCLLSLPATVSRHASIGLVATLSAGGRTVRSVQRPAPIAPLKDCDSPAACGD